MKVKVGASRPSWEALPESASMADGDSQSLPLNPSLLSLDALQHPHQPSEQDLNHNDSPPEPEADGNEPDEDDEDDGNEDGELDGDGDDDNAQERPTLDEGFYEIETVRRKRVRKGQVQYFIKWRGWPETANTWEPMENLQPCSDVIEAFEEGLRSGKLKRRKRKSGILHTHVKKRHQRSTFATFSNADSSHKVNLEGVNLADDQPIAYSLHKCNGEVNTGETSHKVNTENGRVNVAQRSSGRRKKKDYDPKLSELKATTSGGSVAVQFQEVKGSEVNGQTEEIPETETQSTEIVRSTRSTGAKRRKSGSVKRFKPEPHLYDAAVLQNLTTGNDNVLGGRMDILADGYSSYGGDNSYHRNNTDGSDGNLRITKILKPIAYSASMVDDGQDVEVTFLVKRSDGMEVMVDNKFLKNSNPHLLINYYEQHLRYNPSS